MKKCLTAFSYSKIVVCCDNQLNHTFTADLKSLKKQQLFIMVQKEKRSNDIYRKENLILSHVKLTVASVLGRDKNQCS